MKLTEWHATLHSFADRTGLDFVLSNIHGFVTPVDWMARGVLLDRSSRDKSRFRIAVFCAPLFDEALPYINLNYGRRLSHPQTGEIWWRVTGEGGARTIDPPTVMDELVGQADPWLRAHSSVADLKDLVGAAYGIGRNEYWELACISFLLGDVSQALDWLDKYRRALHETDLERAANAKYKWAATGYDWLDERHRLLAELEERYDQAGRDGVLELLLDIRAESIGKLRIPTYAASDRLELKRARL